MIGGKRMNVTGKKIEMVILLGVVGLLLFLAGVALKVTSFLVGGAIPLLIVGCVFFLITHVPSRKK